MLNPNMVVEIWISIFFYENFDLSSALDIRVERVIYQQDWWLKGWQLDAFSP